MSWSKLEKCLKKATEQYIELQRRARTFDSIKTSERIIKVGEEEKIVNVGDEMPIMTYLGVALVRVYDIRIGERGIIEFGVGNETLPILEYIKKEDFYYDWPA
ncbi:MAG: hypothetical protein AABX30_02365 [Nanoarchaeota archaeon]